MQASDAKLLLAALLVFQAKPALAGSVDVLGVLAEYKVTLTYGVAVRAESPEPALVDGPVDRMQVEVNLIPSLSCVQPPCIGSFGHTGMPITTNFDDGNRDFQRGALLNNRLSGYGQLLLNFESFGLGDIGAVASGAAHYDAVFHDPNDHDNEETVNRIELDPTATRRLGPVNEWNEATTDVNGKRHRLLESYVYGNWYLTDTMGLALRAGKHLAAWGESLFFPGIASAQAPFDATKANVPGAEVKEILLPVNQVSMQLALNESVSLLGYSQFEFKPTEVFPQGDFFSPADLIGPGATFGYGSINPLHPDQCDKPDVVTNSGAPAPPGTLCLVAGLFQNAPEYIYTVRTPDAMPSDKDQWGSGVRFQLQSGASIGAYYLRYNNHNPNVTLNMGYPRVGDLGGSPVTTEALGVRVPVSYTVGYAENVEMYATSFSTVLGPFNVAGEVVRRENVDLAVEATIAGVIAPVGTRGRTSTGQVSFLYVTNPHLPGFDELAVVGEVAYTQVDKVAPRTNEDGICYSGTTDCLDFTQQGDQLFYDRNAWAMQILLMPKGRNAFDGWDIGLPMTFSWLAEGTPSTPGVFGALYGEGDLRAGIGITAQFLQNTELTLGYNAFFGDPEKTIRNSTLRANPFVDHDYAAFSIKYNL